MRLLTRKQVTNLKTFFFAVAGIIHWEWDLISMENSMAYREAVLSLRRERK